MHDIQRMEAKTNPGARLLSTTSVRSSRPRQIFLVKGKGMFQTNGLTWPGQTPVKLAQSNPQCNRLISNLVALQYNALGGIQNTVLDWLQMSTFVT